MTEVLLVSVYLFVLAAFVGLDVISKAPPAIYTVLVAMLGLLTGFAALAPWGIIPGTGLLLGGPLGMAATALGGVAFGAGVMALGKLTSNVQNVQKGGH